MQSKPSWGHNFCIRFRIEVDYILYDNITSNDLYFEKLIYFWSKIYSPIQMETYLDLKKISEDAFIVVEHFYVVALRGLCLSFVIIKEAEPI